MNVCFIGSFSAGGTESATFAVANALADTPDYHVSVISCGFDYHTFELNQRIDFHHIPSANILKRNYRVFKLLRRLKIDILVCVEAMAGILCLLPALAARCKFVVWEHANYFQSQGSKYIQKIRQLELRWADAYVVLTKRDKRNFLSHFKIKCRLEQIYNIIAPRPNAEYNKDSHIIVSAGHINRIKNFIIIPQIADKVFKHHPDWQWHIYGYDNTPIADQLRSEIQRLNLQDNVIICGRSDNMSQVYASAAMYVMTSLQEGFPMVLLEAKAAQLPLISFDIETGPDEIIRHNQNGFLIPPYNTDCMADAILALIESPTMRAQFSTAASLDLPSFAPAQILPRWTTLLSSL